MARAIVACTFVIALLCGAQDEKKVEPKTTPSAIKQEKAKKAGQPLVGRLVRVDGEKRTLSVEVSLQIPQVNSGAVRRLAQIQGDLARAQAKGDVGQIRSIAQEISRTQTVTYREEKRTIDFVAEDNAVVRTMVLPLEYTEKGKPKRLTEKEKRDLKGPDPKLRGYQSEFDSLQAEQVIEVYPIATKENLKTTKDASAPKTEGKPAPDAKPELPKIRVGMIVILTEPLR